MRNLLLFTPALFILLLACTPSPKKSIQTTPEPPQPDIQTFDSTYYHLLQKSRELEDTALLHTFFEAWHEATKHHYNEPKDTLQVVLEEIFEAVSQPQKVGSFYWNPERRRTNPEQAYKILQTRINYKILDSGLPPIDVAHDSFYRKNLDTLSTFFPSPDLGGKIPLPDLEPFKTSLCLFIQLDDSRDPVHNNYRWTNSVAEIFFLHNLRRLNICANNAGPSFIGVLLDSNMQSALVSVGHISTIFRISLEFRQGKWRLTHVLPLDILD